MKRFFSFNFHVFDHCNEICSSLLKIMLHIYGHCLSDRWWKTNATDTPSLAMLEDSFTFFDVRLIGFLFSIDFRFFCIFCWFKLQYCWWQPVYVKLSMDSSSEDSMEDSEYVKRLR